jgi:hypothetical protein
MEEAMGDDEYSDYETDTETEPEEEEDNVGISRRPTEVADTGMECVADTGMECVADTGMECVADTVMECVADNIPPKKPDGNGGDGGGPEAVDE